jgi:hypothetical protein
LDGIKEASEATRFSGVFSTPFQSCNSTSRLGILALFTWSTAMLVKTVWQQGSNNPENASHFDTIRQWWMRLNGKEVTWRQRLLPPSGQVAEITWEPQRFDEVFLLRNPEVRGITLYWRKPNSEDERNATVHKLELDHLRQQLYIFPQSQRTVVIQIGLPQVVYQQVTLQQPKCWVQSSETSRTLVLRDEAQRLEIQVLLDAELLAHLRQLGETYST